MVGLRGGGRAAGGARRDCSRTGGVLEGQSVPEAPSLTAAAAVRLPLALLADVLRHVEAAGAVGGPGHSLLQLPARHRAGPTLFVLIITTSTRVHKPRHLRRPNKKTKKQKKKEKGDKARGRSFGNVHSGIAIRECPRLCFTLSSSAADASLMKSVKQRQKCMVTGLIVFVRFPSPAKGD